MGKRRVIALLSVGLLVTTLFLGVNYYSDVKLSIRFADLHPDNTHILFYSKKDNYFARYGTIIVYNYIKHTIDRRISTSISYFTDLAISPDGKYVAISGYSGYDENPSLIQVFEIETEKKVFEKKYTYPKGSQRTGNFDSAVDKYIQWSHDGTSLVAQLYDIDPPTYWSQYECMILVINTQSWEIKTEFQRELSWGRILYDQSGTYIWYTNGEGTELLDLREEVPTDPEFVDTILFNETMIARTHGFYPLWSNESIMLFTASVDVLGEYPYVPILFSYNYSSVSITQVAVLNIMNKSADYLQINYDGSLLAPFTSYNTVPILKIPELNEYMMVDHPYQEMVVCWTIGPNDNCPELQFHYWSHYNNYLMYTNTDYQANGEAIIDIMDVDSGTVVSSFNPEIS